MNKDKILLSVYLPAGDKVIEARVPRGLKVALVTEMLADMMKRAEGDFIPTGNELLCDKKSGMIFDTNVFIENLGLHNGSEVMLL